jgi:hypothetical protein
MNAASAPDQWLAAIVDASDEQLIALLRYRPDLALPEPASLAELAERATSPASVEAFHRAADVATRRLLEALCVIGPAVTVAALGGALGCEPAMLSPLLDRLAGSWLLLPVDGDRVAANTGLAKALQWPCGLGPPAAALLERRPNSELVAINRRLGLSPNGAKPALVKRIVEFLSDPKRLRQLLDDAPAGVEDLVRTAAHRWPNLHLSYPVEMMLRRNEGAPAWCIQRGLIVATGFSTAVMPREVALGLRGGRVWASFDPSPPPIARRDVDQDEVDRQAAGTALALVADVTAICEAWSAAPAKPLQSGGVGVRDIRKAAKAIGRSEDATARVVQLAHVAGLLDSDALAVAPTAGYDAWLARSGPARWVELAEAWMTLPLHLSVAGALDPDGKAVPPMLGFPLAFEAIAQRNLVMGALAEAGPGRATDPAGVVGRVLWQKPVVWERADLAQPDVMARWILAEAEMLGAGAAGTLSGFARLLVDGDASGAEKALAGLAPPQVDRVILQADLTATVAGEAAPALRSGLDLLADVESSGHATVWRFSEASLRRAFDAGQKPTEILDFLAGHAARGVPQPLAYLIEDLGRRHGRIRVGPAACYLRGDDPSLLSELLRSKKTARLRLRLLAPTVAVSDRSPHEVTEALRAGGYLPAQEAEDATVVVARPPARRIGGPPPRVAGTGRAGPPDLGDLDVYEFDDYLDTFGDPIGLDDIDDVDDEDLEAGAEVLSELSGIPRDLLLSLVRSGSEGAAAALAEEGLAGLLTRLRAAPPRPAAARPSPAKEGSSRHGQPFVRLFDDDTGDGRPSHIARGRQAVDALLAEALDSRWAVRMSYVNSAGLEREFFAEIIDLGRGTVRLRYLDQHGGGELATWRIQWARVATEAEEDNLY